MTEHASEQPGARVLGRYRLRARIGRGRLGDIYEALDETSLAFGAERLVAIQLLDEKLASDEDFVDRLRRGYAALDAGSHPNVVDLLDFGCDGRLRFLIMEFLEGASLRFVLDCVSAPPADEMTAIVRGVGDALQYLHTKSMSHGRVTPENVLITNDYGVKLLDLVPALPASPPPGVEIPGRGPTRAADARDDVFGLACLAYEMLAGRHPFNSNSPLEARRAGLEPEPIESLPARQWHALAHGLVLEHERRTPTIRDFLREFGVQGTERLRPAASGTRTEPLRPAASETRAVRPVERPAEPPAVERPARDEPRLLPTTRSGASLGAIVGLAAAASVVAGVLLFRNPLLDWAAAWGSDGDTQDASGVAERDPSAEPALEPDSPGASRTHVAAVTLAASQRPRLEQPGLAQPVPESSDSVSTQTQTSSGQPESTQPAPEQTDSPRPTSREPQTSARAESAQVASEIPAAPLADNVVAAPAFAVTEPMLAVREGASVAQVPLRRAGDTAAMDSVVWWTGDRTALADDDYAAIAAQVEQFAPGEESRALYVPLIDDSLPEPAESFFVYVGRYGADGGSLETIAQVTVDIVDDD